MIVAGIGCRKGASEQQVAEALADALAAYGMARVDLGLLVTGDIKRHEAGIAAAARACDVPLMILDEARLKAAAARCLTRSERSVEIAGVPSLAEAAALVGAGTGGRLLGPRSIRDGVTCALAETARANPGVAP